MRLALLIIIIILLAVADLAFSLRCYHCIKRGDGVCIHPEKYFPPIAYCGGGEFSCGYIMVILKPKETARVGQLYMSFGDDSAYAEFRGCVKPNYCNSVEKTKYDSIGGEKGKCYTCDTDICNLTCSNIWFASKMKLCIIVILHFVNYYL